MGTAQTATKKVLVRKFPVDLLERVDAFAVDAAGDGATPSRERTLLILINRGLNDVTRPRTKASK
jgi:hypothetical protein